MAQLAGKELTRQAIFLVETGKTRPSMRTLELIAMRTGKSPGYFRREKAESSSMIEDLQALCLQQQFDKAVILGREMLRRELPAATEAYVRHYLGQALVRSSHPDEGLEHLRRAQVLNDAERDPWLAIECADWEASALYLKEDPRALAVAEHALQMCRATEPRLPGTEARILEHIASIHVKNHTHDEAIRFYEEALETAGALKDLARMGRTFHGLSIAYQERGDLARAVEYTHKALALYSLDHDMALLARGENELGLLLMRQGHLDRAEASFQSALSHFEEAATEVAKSNVLVSLGELNLKRGRLDEGIAITRRGLELAERLGERLAESEAREMLGRLHERKGNSRLADEEFNEAIRVLAAHGYRDRLAEVHAAYAELLEARSDTGGAASHWKEAAELSLRRAPAASQTAR